MKKFSVEMVCARTAASAKVAEEYARVQNLVIDSADSGFSVMTATVDLELRDPLARKFRKDGFEASVRSDGKLEISWKKNAETRRRLPEAPKSDCNITLKRPGVTTLVNGKKVEEEDEAKAEARNIPTDKPMRDKAEEKVEEESANDETTATSDADTKNDSDGKKNMLNRSVVFENCTFNISVPVNVDVHHFGIHNRKNAVDRIIK